MNQLLNHWKHERSEKTNQPVSIGTIKNRMAVLRWWANKINKQNIIPRDNKSIAIDDRARTPTTNKAWSLTQSQLTTLPRYLQLSLRLQQEFGLRREEAAKFVPAQAIKPNHIEIARSWAKGGRERMIPITTQAQLDLIRELRNWTQSRSLIPNDQSYKTYLMHREHCLSQAGIRKSHGLRHFYAQTRYTIVSGGLIPRIISGIPTYLLSKDDQQRDYIARSVVSQELGHGRIDVTRIYLG